ncbi:MAG TPA: hypothetical protein PLH31_16820, partial [Caulobacter sp.]|nr:hypothetical protein [Caulobacter sp.]
MSLVEAQGIVQVACANGYFGLALQARRIDIELERRGPDVVSVASNLSRIIFNVVGFRIVGVGVLSVCEPAVETGHRHQVA